MPSHPLTTKDIQGSDPLAKLFFNVFKLKWFGMILFFMFAGFLYGYIIPNLYNVSPASDLITLINIVLVFPTAGYYYAYQPKSILRIYQSATRFFKEENLDTVPYEKIKTWHAKPIWWILGIAIGVISAGFGILNAIHSFGATWENINWLQITLVFGTRFLAMSMIGMIVMRHIATSMALTELFQYTEFPLTLDTDKIEVFSSVKRFSLEIIGVAAIIGLNLGLQPLVIEVPIPEYIFYVVMYFILVPITFFLPLWQVHRRMVTIKHSMLDKLHKDYQEEAEKLYNTLAKDPKKDLSSSYLKQTERMTSIKQAVELINKSPDWPFEGTVFYRLIVTILSPFFLNFFEIFINIVNGIIYSN
jgi:hypothetical protein